MKIVNVTIKEIYERNITVEVPDNILLEESNDYITNEAYKQYQLCESKGNKTETIFEFENVGDKYEYEQC